MELKDFIKNTISSISEAISESQQELKSKNILVNPERYDITEGGHKVFGKYEGMNNRHLQTLEFDVVVGVETEEGSTAGGRIKIVEFFSAGAEKSKSHTNANQNRIKFEIPIAFSTIEVPDELKGIPKPKPTVRF